MSLFSSHVTMSQPVGYRSHYLTPISTDTTLQGAGCEFSLATFCDERALLQIQLTQHEYLASMVSKKDFGLMARKEDLTVFITAGDATCDECGEELGRKAWICLGENRQAYCLTCSDLDHLVFQPAGDAALTRRSRKYSRLSAVVVKWSKARKRYERQGVLVEEKGLQKAEEECLADQEVRESRRQRQAKRTAKLDKQYVKRFTEKVRELYPNCPDKREEEIAEHACLKYSGRVGRSAAAKTLDEGVVRLAVVAHIRHRETCYDGLLSNGWGRLDARLEIEKLVHTVLSEWEASPD